MILWRIQTSTYDVKFFLDKPPFLTYNIYRIIIDIDELKK